MEEGEVGGGVTTQLPFDILFLKRYILYHIDNDLRVILISVLPGAIPMFEKNHNLFLTTANSPFTLTNKAFLINPILTTGCFTHVNNFLS